MKWVIKLQWNTVEPNQVHEFSSVGELNALATRSDEVTKGEHKLR